MSAAAVLHERHSRRVAAAGAVRLHRVLAAEGIKLRTLPSYAVSFVLAYLVLAGFGLLSAYAAILQRDDPEPTVIAEPGSVLAGVQGVQLLSAFVAVVFATSEFAQYTIQPTYLATPTRLPVLFSKAALLVAAALVIGSAGAATALLGALALLDAAGMPFELDLHRAIRLIAGTGLYLAAVSLVGLGIGMLVRSTVGALLGALTLISVLPLIVGAAPFAWLRDAAAYLPSSAGLLILRPDDMPAVMEPWTGLALAGAWGIGLLAVSAVAVRRADA